jgi:hypothetical protein
MKRLLILLAAIPSVALADVTPHPNMHIGKPKPAAVTQTGSPTGGAPSIWLNGKYGDLSGSTIENFVTYTQRSGIRIANGAHDIKVRDGDLYLIAPTTSPNLPVGLEIIDGYNIEVDHVTSHDFMMVKVDGHYNNGDCFSGEKAAHDIVFRDTHAINCSDGGFDFKSYNITFDNTSAENAGHCYRLWGLATLTTASCKDWRDSGLQVMPHATVTVDLFKAEPRAGNRQAVFEVRPTASLTVKACEGVLNPGQKWLVYEAGATPENTTVNLGPTCH